MGKNSQHKKKPGIKDVVKVVSSIIQELQIMQDRINQCYGALDTYIEFNKDEKKFRKFLDKKLEEYKKNDNSKNEQADGGDTDGDKENAGVGAEGIRS